MSRRTERLIVVLVFLASAVLRFGVAAWNQEANDPHLPVINIILEEGRLPHARECWECFQPKMWYVGAAGMLRALDVGSVPEQRVVLQLLNVVLSLITLAMLWQLLSRAAFRPAVRVLAFSLFTLNPKWIGISAQATNDSIVILFSTLCLCQAYKFFSSGRSLALVWMSLAAILAAASKGNGILIPLIVVATFVVRGLQAARLDRRAAWSAVRTPLLVFVLLQASIIPFLGPYWSNYQHLGSPFVTNFPVQPRPALFEDSIERRPGITSVASGYFTFRMVDLLRTPRVSHNKFEYPMHRTSLWSQIYGRSHSLHFDDWPRSWQSQVVATDWITRLIFLLALVPTALLLVALFASAKDEARRTLGNEPGPSTAGGTVWTVAVLAYLAFAVLYSARYRDYSTMKAIFVFPVLPALIFLQASGLEWVETKAADHPRLRNAAWGAIVLLLALYGVDVAILIYELAAG